MSVALLARVYFVLLEELKMKNAHYSDVVGFKASSVKIYRKKLKLSLVIGCKQTLIRIIASRRNNSILLTTVFFFQKYVPYGLAVFFIV